MRFYHFSETGTSAPMTSQLLPFGRRCPLVRNCLACGSHFQPLAPHHFRCKPCFFWGRALYHLAAADRAFDAIRTQCYR
jgi:hypothetical protein